MKNIKSYKLFEKKKIGEIETLNKESIHDLTEFKDALTFVSEYNLDIYDVIELIDKLLNSNWSEIMEIRNHLSTNETRSDKDEFMIELIDRYCSNIEIN